MTCGWVIGLTVAFALLWWWMLEYAVRLRRRLRERGPEAESVEYPILTSKLAHRDYD